MMEKPLLSFWQKYGVDGVDNMALKEYPLTAFFASSLCSGRAILVAMDWARIHYQTRKIMNYQNRKIHCESVCF
jgi:hypothetical protein